MKKYANGGASGVPRPPKGEKYAAEANDWRAGEDEFAMAKEKAKPAAKKRREPRDAFLPGVNYDKEFKTYVDKRDSKGRSYTPRTQPGFTIKRNDQDLAAQSAVDENMSGRNKRHGGGPGQRPGVNMIDNLKRYAKGGSVSSRADGMAQRGKTNCKYR